jgi:hypothetical protein
LVIACHQEWFDLGNFFGNETEVGFVALFPLKTDGAQPVDESQAAVQRGDVGLVADRRRAVAPLTVPYPSIILTASAIRLDDCEGVMRQTRLATGLWVAVALVAANAGKANIRRVEFLKK